MQTRDYTVIIRSLPSADRDATEIEDRLESEQAGYGKAFTDLFEIAVKRIAESPRLYPRTEDGPRKPENREYYIKRFEYRMIYAVSDSELVILALVHARNRPKGWVRRIRDMK